MMELVTIQEERDSLSTPFRRTAERSVGSRPLKKKTKISIQQRVSRVHDEIRDNQGWKDTFAVFVLPWEAVFEGNSRDESIP